MSDKHLMKVIILTSILLLSQLAWTQSRTGGPTEGDEKKDLEAALKDFEKARSKFYERVQKRDVRHCGEGPYEKIWNDGNLLKSYTAITAFRLPLEKNACEKLQLYFNCLKTNRIMNASEELMGTGHLRAIMEKKDGRLTDEQWTDLKKVFTTFNVGCEEEEAGACGM